ncbi:MAG: platelet-activating factor acetylhydrolase IB subunit [Chthoniobacter sp.]|nr:platelet-activating factor acetylhydrolase IB subunit [Chthoniobacter sp.]
MKLLPLHTLLAVSLVFASTLRAQDKAATTATPAAAATPAATPFPLPVQQPDVGAIKFDPKTGKENTGFLAAHARYVAIAKEGKAQLLFLGDSITAGWATKGKEVWDKSFTQWEPANFGIGGDRTQHVLWRIENGELEGIKPKAAVLMIGTNNVRTDSAEGIAKGVTKIVQTIRTKTPDTKILLLAVFPRGENAGTPAKPNADREKLGQVNKIIAKLADDKHVFFLDIGAKFLQSDGSITKDIMGDALHPTAAGYQIWADAITPKVTELMK